MLWNTHMVGGAAAWLGFTAAPVVADWLGSMFDLPPLVVPLVALVGKIEVPQMVAVVGLPVAAVAALGPDIDSRNAKATRSLGWGTYRLHLWLKRHLGDHREGMHSILAGIPLVGLMAALAVLGIMALAAWRSESSTGVSWLLVAGCGLAGFVGAWSHSALDSLTNGGVQWLWPFRKRRYGLSLMTVGGWAESVVARPLLVVLAGVAGVATISGW